MTLKMMTFVMKLICRASATIVEVTQALTAPVYLLFGFVHFSLSSIFGDFCLHKYMLWARISSEGLEPNICTDGKTCFVTILYLLSFLVGSGRHLFCFRGRRGFGRGFSFGQMHQDRADAQDKAFQH